MQPTTSPLVRNWTSTAKLLFLLVPEKVVLAVLESVEITAANSTAVGSGDFDRIRNDRCAEGRHLFEIADELFRGELPPNLLQPFHKVLRRGIALCGPYDRRFIRVSLLPFLHELGVAR